MILYEVTFGKVAAKDRQEAEDLVDWYLSCLVKNGQACEDYFLILRSSKLCAYVALRGTKAHLPKYHCEYGRGYLKRVKAFFGTAPRWKLIDDDAPHRDTLWTGASFLYLATHMLDYESPLWRGDNGKPIPFYRVPGTHEDRQSVHFWSYGYRSHDLIWFRSGALEIPAYRQLAEPSSDLSQEGLALCAMIEKATGVPTYYYIMRFWGRRKGEERRKCPGCGRKWRTQHPAEEGGPFWQFAFRCERCRLVSHLAVADDDERHASIGEYSPGKARKAKNRAT
jgi:predicted  nucleic acid-binding Zn ribbon protein